MKRKFIINPNSGSGLTSSKLTKMKLNVLKQIDHFDYVITKDKNDIVFQTQKALQNGADQIVAIGGDGTIHQVANGFFKNQKIINDNASLMVTNEGTGSDFYKTVAKGQTWDSFLVNHKIKKVDLGNVLFHNKKEEYFINMASLGISASIVKRKEGLSSWVPKNLKYIAPTLQSFLSFKGNEAEIITDSETVRGKISGVFICKGLYAGGGMKFGCNSKLDDGLFDITILKDISNLKLLKSFTQIFSGLEESTDQIIRLKSSSISINSKNNLEVELDGEYFPKANLDIRVLTKALNVCFPD